jgi:hypothetical protein
MIALRSLYHIIFSGWSDRWERFSDDRDQRRTGAVDEDIHRPHINGLVNCLGVKVLRRFVRRLSHRCLVLTPVLDRPDRLVQADEKAQKSIPSY